MKIGTGVAPGFPDAQELVAVVQNLAALKGAN
jgi:hypothetical protein